MSIEKLTEFSKTGVKDTDELDLEAGFPVRLQPARQWMNWLFNALTKKVNEIIDVSDDLVEKVSGLITRDDDSIGLIYICPFETIPSNHLECDGQIYNKADYPKLAEKLGNMYGGDANTFAVPDYRAEFVRGWDHGKGVDAGRGLGSTQGDAIRNITGRFTGGFSDSIVTGAFEIVGTSSGQDGSSSSQKVYEFNASKVVPTADENRPRNTAAIYVIKAK